MAIGEEIRRLRKERGWTFNELAKRSHVNSGTLRSIETGKSKNPTTSNLLKIASAFGKRYEELFQAAGYIKDARVAYQPRKETPEELLDRFRINLPESVPIYDYFPFHAGNQVEPTGFTPVVRDRSKTRNLEGYIAKGKCLEPEVRDGDIIIIDRNGQIEHGDIVACLVGEELHLARLRKISGELYLENNERRIKLEEAQIAAPVIEVRRRFK